MTTKSKKVTTLIIDRRKWLRGEYGSMLHRESDHKMCCLGMYGRACGIPSEKLLGLAAPNMTAHSLGKKLTKKWQTWLFSGSSQSLLSSDASLLIRVNDDTSQTSEKDRETQIKTVFALHGVKIIFRN